MILVLYTHIYIPMYRNFPFTELNSVSLTLLARQLSPKIYLE